jgi:hypothetical protein
MGDDAAFKVLKELRPDIRRFLRHRRNHSLLQDAAPGASEKAEL